MSHVENAERKNGSGRTSDVAADTQDKSIIGARSESPIDDEETEVELKTSQIPDDASNLDTNGDIGTYPDTKARDNDVRTSSGDICRICHMGGYGLITENHSFTRDSQNQGERTSNFVHLGPLISACKCRGTVALVHVECLERWLTESGRARCELCGHKYAAKRVPRYGLLRSVLIWFHAVIATRQEMLLDIGYLAMTTPVAVFSCYVCALALKMLLRNGFYEIPWMIVAMLPTCLLTLIAYWRWIITLGRLHGHQWRRYWRNNFVIRLMPDNVNNNVDNANNINNATDHPSIEYVDARDFEQWMLEEIEELA